MTPQTKKIVIWSSVAVVLGVGGYFLYNYFKNNPRNSNNDSDGQDGQGEQQGQQQGQQQLQQQGQSQGQNSSGLSEGQTLVLSRVQSAVAEKDSKGRLSVRYTWAIWTSSDFTTRDIKRMYDILFLNDNTFEVLNERDYAVFKGTYSEGGRKITITKDDYSKTSKVGTTISTQNFFKTFEKLFTDRKTKK
jgi:hypothetical protein